MPEVLNLPETRPEAGVEHADVMGFLGLKRAPTISPNSGSDLKP